MADFGPPLFAGAPEDPVEGGGVGAGFGDKILDEGEALGEGLRPFRLAHLGGGNGGLCFREVEVLIFGPGLGARGVLEVGAEVAVNRLAI